MKRIWLILVMTVILTVVVFVLEKIPEDSSDTVIRNSYGEGDKTSEYELTIEGELEDESIQVEIGEQEYTASETRKMFRDVMQELDQLILGENESFNRIETNLNLVTSVKDYPVQIRWSLDSYDVMSMEGEIKEDNVTSEGSLVELQATLSYGAEEALYVRNLMVFAPSREGREKWLYDVRQEIKRLEENTRKEESFSLPQTLNGKALQWSEKKEEHWYLVLLIGFASAAYLMYREREKVRQKDSRRKEELLRQYPGMISKFTMLLGTGTTVRKTWEKIVQNYEEQREQLGSQIVYEEMLITYREIQGGVSETEAYEKFGRRCGLTVYIKFGTMLAQNLRKGSKGITDILRMEAIQSFENRKSTAKILGEEAGTKLLMPMLGMLLVVLVMIMIPAFLSMQI